MINSSQKNGRYEGMEGAQERQSASASAYLIVMPHHQGPGRDVHIPDLRWKQKYGEKENKEGQGEGEVEEQIEEQEEVKREVRFGSNLYEWETKNSKASDDWKG